jgi:threonine aldolase
MANQLCIATQTRPGDQVLLDADAHILNHEFGAAALLSGVQLRTVRGNLGRLSADMVRGATVDASEHEPPTTLICLENTHNRGGGSVYDPREMAAIKALAAGANVRVHLDGARLWNAAAAAGIPEAEFAQHADTVSVCFSKGLGAPVGSLIAGTRAFMKRAHRLRKIFGGGMRQAGILAAAALYAVDNHRASLADDHEKARGLAEKLMQAPVFTMEAPPQTNIVYVNVINPRVDARRLEADCAAAGVLFFAEGASCFRLVTHRDVSRADVDAAADIILKHIS